MYKKQAEKKIVYNARFVKETFGEKYKVRPGDVFYKTWTFRNEGETAWPHDAVLSYTNGDDFKAVSQPVLGTVNPGDQIDIGLKMQAPQLPGKYCAFFRFVYGDNLRFGQKVWADIMVEDGQEEVFKSFMNPMGQSQYDDQNLNASSFSQQRSSLLKEDFSQENVEMTADTKLQEIEQ